MNMLQPLWASFSAFQQSFNTRCKRISLIMQTIISCNVLQKHARSKTCVHEAQETIRLYGLSIKNYFVKNTHLQVDKKKFTYSVHYACTGR